MSGGYTIYAIRDLTAKLMSEVCHDVQVEPHLQPLSGELLQSQWFAIQEDDARVDIRAAGFWGCRHHCLFFDVRVFNAFAESNQSPRPAATLQRHEGDKCRAYQECVREAKRGSFTPLVFSSSGVWKGLPQSLTDALPPFLSVKWNSLAVSSDHGMAQLFSQFFPRLLRSALMCLRGLKI